MYEDKYFIKQWHWWIHSKDDRESSQCKRCSQLVQKSSQSQQDNLNNFNMSLNVLVQKAKELFQKQKVNIDFPNERQVYKQRVLLYKNLPIGTQVESQDRSTLLGIEFDPLITSEFDLVQFIMRKHLYLPQIYLNEEQLNEFGNALEECDQLDRRNLGCILGMTLLGVLGFVVLGFTVIGLLAGGVLGLVLGRYAGKRVKKSLQKNNHLEEFDLFEIRTRCFIKWTHSRGVKYRYNVNMLRFIVEKLLLEIKPALHYKKFSPRHMKHMKHLLVKVNSVIKEEHFLYALTLSLRISEELFRILKLFISNELTQIQAHELEHYQEFRTEIEVSLLKQIDNVLKPMVSLFFDCEPKNMSNQMQQLCTQSKAFLLHPEILSINQMYPDPQMTVNYIKMLSEKMKIKIQPKDIELYIKQQNFRDLEQIGKQIDQYDMKVITVQLNMKPVPEEEERLESDQQSQLENKMQQIIEIQSPSKQSVRIEDVQVKEELIKSNSKKGSMSDFKLQIRQHPNRVFMNKLQSRTGDPDHFDNLKSKKPINEIQDIYIILEPEQQIVKQERQKSIVIEKQIQKSQQFDQVKHENRYSEETANKFSMFLIFYNESVSLWENVCKKEDIYIYKAMKPGTGSVFLKGHALVRNHDKNIVFRAVYDKQFRIKWYSAYIFRDKIIQGFDIIKRESEDSDIMYYFVGPPIPIVAVREWVQRRVLRYDYPEKGQICLLFYSVELPSPQPDKSRIRAHTEIAGYVFENVPEGTKISFVSNNDVRGSIPKMLVNHASAKGPFGWFGNLRKACDQYRQFNGDISKVNIK